MTQTYFAGRPLVNETMADEHQHRREIARAVNNNTRGLNNTSLSVTLDTGGTTVITDARISLQTALLLMPTSAAAAAALPGLYIVCEKGAATITSSAAGAVFTAVLIG